LATLWFVFGFNEYLNGIVPYMKRIILISVLLFAQLLAFSQSAWSDTQKWKVNLKDADIRAFITQISDITGYSFVVDPRVRGNVTVVSNVAMDKDAIYEMFLSVLDVHGYSAIPSQDVIKIVQQNSAKQSAVNLKLFKNVPKQQMVTRVIQVKNTNALELVPILRPMVAKYGHLAGVASANALIISDQIDNIIRISHIVAQLDSPSKYEIEVVQLKEAWVGDMVKLLEKLAPAELGKNNIKDSARKYSVVADE
jgi:general secretion pathway protein D